MIRLFIHGHVSTAIATASLVYFVSQRLGIEAQHAAAGIVFAATLLIYNLDHLFDGLRAAHRNDLPRRLDDRHSAGRPTSWPRSERCLPLGRIRALIALSAAILIYFLWRAPASTRAIVGIGTVLSSAYGVPFPPGSRRLKDLPWLKVVMVPVAVTLAVFLVPISIDGLDWIRAFGLDVLVVFLLALSGATICDMHDASEDEAENLRTLPLMLGKNSTRALLATAHALVAGLVLTVSSDPAPIILVALAFSATVAVLDFRRRSVHAVLTDVALLLPVLVLL